MNPGHIKALLERVERGATTPDEALEALRDLPFADLGYANVDHHRALRMGVPEVIFGEGKTAEQITGIAEELSKKEQNVLVTRLDAEKAALVVNRLPRMKYAPIARTASLEIAEIPARPCGPVAVVSAGTSDMPVAEEAFETLRMLGIEAKRVYDVGVSGLHRLLERRALLEQAAGIIVVAGMEGALPSVVAGLTSKPLVAVPTSVGYGVHLSGLTPLFAMLTSCASGVVVVNIDNGFGAAMAFHRMLPRAG